MHNGHRGINHPVKNLKTGKGEITSQNHGFAVNREEAEANPELEISHIHLNDHTVAGISMKNKKCFSVQYHRRQVQDHMILRIYLINLLNS